MSKYKIVKFLNLTNVEIEMQLILDTDTTTIEGGYNQKVSKVMPCSFSATHNDAVYCMDENDNKFTLFDCNYVCNPFDFSILLTYNGVICGAHISNLNTFAVTSYTAYLKNTVVKQAIFSEQQIKIGDELELYTNRYKTKVDETTYFLGDILSIRSLNCIQYEKLKHVFNSVRALIYLSVGYFDSIDKIEIITESGEILTYYNANESIYSHANKHNFGYLYLAETKDIAYKTALPLWDEIKNIGMYSEQDGAFFHYLIAAQNVSIPVEIRLCMLIQCIDGFINKRYLSKFTGDDIIKFGDIKNVKLKPAIKCFLDLTPFGRIIFNNEIATLSFNGLTSSLASTRKLFSHLGDQKNVFRGKEASIIYKKLLLLWRVVLLESMDIPVCTTQIDKIVERIESSHA